MRTILFALTFLASGAVLGAVFYASIGSAGNDLFATVKDFQALIVGIVAVGAAVITWRSSQEQIKIAVMIREETRLEEAVEGFNQLRSLLIDALAVITPRYNWPLVRPLLGSVGLQGDLPAVIAERCPDAQHAHQGSISASLMNAILCSEVLADTQETAVSKSEAEDKLRRIVEELERLQADVEHGLALHRNRIRSLRDRLDGYTRL